jgi:hypothetical protein
MKRQLQGGVSSVNALKCPWVLEFDSQEFQKKSRRVGAPNGVSAGRREPKLG